MMLTKSVAMSGRTVARPAMSGRTTAIAQPTPRSRCVVVRSAEENKEGPPTPEAIPSHSFIRLIGSISLLLQVFASFKHCCSASVHPRILREHGD
mmetsp:Transcript_25391/g.75020  ORF Transcript_25391/g.75020 Transcript_25391/m.75020 type:complete len:95 (-) Transcript_25391:269-553(-)